jgi:hypothetical protein
MSAIPTMPGTDALDHMRRAIVCYCRRQEFLQPGATMSTSVYFFGGYQASANDMKLWFDTAKAQKPKIDFKTFHWASGLGPDGDKAVKAFRDSGQCKSVVAEIQASKVDLIYIVGHSSGCAIANAVDDSLKDDGQKVYNLKIYDKITLVALDGFLPNPTQLGRSSTQVWSAKYGDLKSLHYGLLLGKVGGRLQVYEPADCNKKTAVWSLHFSLVNKSASVTEINNPTEGYQKCQANLMWLTKEA